jgi:MtfA peptidase
MIGLFKNWQRQRALARVQVDAAQWAAAEAQLPFLGHLDADERQRLRHMVRDFLADKEWTGARGLPLTPAIQLSIALQACLLTLNLGPDHYRGWLGIVVYPGDFVIPRSLMDEDGVVHEYDDPVLGEAWEGGPVLISWFDNPEDAAGEYGPSGPSPQPPCKQGGARLFASLKEQDIHAFGRPCGVNVVIHEFAHKLDMANGAVDGIPALPAEMPRQDWIAAFEPAFEDFRRRVDADEETLLDPYGAEHPAEFFAVMSEAFFETPALLRDEYPAVYRQLQRFYGQDPAKSQVPTR